VTVALFLQLCQILAALGGAGEAFVTIRADIEKRHLKPEDPLPPEHVATIKAAMGSGGSVWDETHGGEGG
jgi:hypothetical protein